MKGRIYIGAPQFDQKNRMYNYNLSFLNRKYTNSMTLSKYVGGIKAETNKFLMIK